MDPKKPNVITVSTHNVNGYRRSKDFLRSRCDQNPDAIRAIQEHWLAPPYKKQFGVNQLRCLHPDFDGFGTSAMKKSVECEIIKGRPFGGTGFLYGKKYAKCLKPLMSYCHERVTVMRLSTSECDIILINVYFPYFNTRDLVNYTSMYRDTVGFIDNVMCENNDCKFIVLADFNCNIFDTSHVYTKLIRQLMVKHNLISGFETDPNFDYVNSFSRCDVKTKSFTLIDGFLISNSLRDSVGNIRISKYGDNLSDHCPVELDLFVNIAESIVKKPKLKQYVNWEKSSEENLLLFRREMAESLSRISVPSSEVLHGDKCCLDDSHKLSIENYHNAIMSAIVNAEAFMPKTDPNFQRSFWSTELDDLKQKSIDCNDYWKSRNCPRTGPIFDCRQKCHYTYKAAVRRQKLTAEKEYNDGLFCDLVNKDSLSFWDTWKSVNKAGSSIVTRINGETDEKGIADSFAEYFESVYSGSDSPEHLALKNDFNERFSSYYSCHINDSISPYYLTWAEMLDIVKKLKIGKSSAGICKPEHILYGCPELLCHLHILFNGMLQHGFVPTEFLKGTVTPIVKDSQGDLSDSKNYRGITLSCLPAKMFEFAIQIKTSHLLGTDELQFGFKSRTSTSHAIYTLKSTIDYFNKKGSNVYVAFLDCTKAFDRISHFGLFSELIRRGIPLCILMCLVFWYLNMTSIVKWGSVVSNSFSVPLGIKQGGINSPEFFSCYFDGLTKLLREKKIGCHMYGIFLAIILFADDICLLAPTRSALEKMISTCTGYCSRYGLDFNTKKSKIMVFSGKKVSYDSLKPIYMNGKLVDYVNSVTYLGTKIVSDRGFGFSSSDDRLSFYRSANSILNSLQKPKEEVLIHLLYAFCIPTLTYACAIKEYPYQQMQDCNTAVNDAIRKIVTFERWESVRKLRLGFGYKSLIEMFAFAKKKFNDGLISHPNCLIRRIAYYNSLEP